MIVKKIAIALIACGSHMAFCGTMGPVCDSSNVKTPCDSRSWQVSGQALYLQTNTTVSQLNSGVTNLSGQPLNYAQPWDWGFRLEAAYQYGKANDININWSHLSNDSQRSFAAPFVVDQLYTHPAGSSALLTSNPKWDNVNLEMGQQLILTENKMVRFHGGVEYLRLKNAHARTISVPSDLSVFNDTKDTSYNGFGPRVGLDFTYAWDHGVSLYVNSAAGLLAGRATSSFNDINTISGVSTTTSGSNSMTSIIPELEGKLGIRYNHALAEGNLTFDGGWLWINYFNAQPGFLAGQQTAISEDFGLQGLYFGLKWQGNLA